MDNTSRTVAGGLDPSNIDLHASQIGDLVEQWLVAKKASAAVGSVFWAPCHWARPSDWLEVRSVERLAVLISTAIRPDNNVCFVSSTRDHSGRSANVIGLITRPTVGWAIVARSGLDDVLREVRTGDYFYDNYDSFAALRSAEICWSWATRGELLDGLVFRIRQN